jgi:4-cresol dehydrogenase (hydroxylating)
MSESARSTCFPLRSPVDELVAALGSDNVETRAQELARVADNTLGVERQVAAVVRPGTTSEVREVVEIANRRRLKLYPVSRGRNIGYGERAPVGDGQVVVDLSRMARIRSFDAASGKVVVEPGVTQRQLYDFLRHEGARFWMDVTGSSLDSSILGNTLEGGFGHTPVGDRRSLIAGVEVVLGNGTLLEAGGFPSLGPDLNGLFVQSNFGIVTALEVTLLPIPESYQSFMIRADDDAGLEGLVDVVCTLRRDGTLTSLVHIVNATRSLMSMMPLPDHLRDPLIDNATAAACASSPGAKVGQWTAIGGLYGTRRQVAARRADVAEAFRGIAAVSFFSDRTVRIAKRLFAARALRSAAWARKPRMGVDALEYIHGLGRGVPSDRGLGGVQWRVARPEDAGYFWFAGVTAGTGRAAREVVRIVERLYREHRFELPVVMTSVKPSRLVATMSCNFNRNDPEARSRAHALHRRLDEEFSAANIGRYRTGILGMDHVEYLDPGKRETLARLKGVLDPNGVIAPGRYGLG